MKILKLPLLIAAVAIGPLHAHDLRGPHGETKAPPLSFSDLSDRIPFSRAGVASGTQYGIAGAGWFDYDNDRDMDLFMTNGAGLSTALFQNQGDDSFIEVTDAAGVRNLSGTTGVVAGDIDSDGFIDLVLLGGGGIVTPNETSPPVVYRNLGDGTFADVSAESGLALTDAAGELLPVPSAWSGAMADLDGDRDLDIFLTSPGSITFHNQPPSKLFRNLGNFRFVEVTTEAGLAGATLGACVAGFSDYDSDGDVDLFVGNCQDGVDELEEGDLFYPKAPIQVFRNDGKFKFTDVTVASGIGATGGYWQGMSFADYNHDGNMDLFTTSAGFVPTQDPNDPIAQAPHALFRNNGNGTFTEVARAAGVADFQFSWGTSFADFNGDGYADIFAIGTAAPWGLLGPRFGNPGRLFLNDNERFHSPDTFTEHTPDGESFLQLGDQYTSGVATADFNNDGAQDLLIVRDQWPIGTGSGAPILLRNDSNRNHWLGVDLKGVRSNAFGVGAKVMLVAGGICQFQEVYVGSSFASTNAARLTFNMGPRRSPAFLVVTWPSGIVETFHPQRLDRIQSFKEGKGVRISGHLLKHLIRACR